ncbi:MAG: hypothetical protein B6D41_11905, partial [Chloroflexi bacterium UTCFX4]
MQRIRRGDIGYHRAVGAAIRRGGHPTRVIFPRGVFQRGVKVLRKRVIRRLQFFRIGGTVEGLRGKDGGAQS